MSKSFAAVIYALSLAFFGFFFIWPIGQTLGGALFDNNRFTLAFIGEPFFFCGVAKLIVLVAVALGLTWVDGRSEEVPGIVFASYNVQSYIGDDTSEGPRAAKPKPEASIEALVRVVAAVRPAVAATAHSRTRRAIRR